MRNFAYIIEQSPETKGGNKLKKIILVLFLFTLFWCGCDDTPNKPPTPPECQGVIIDDNPVWSPDGKTIAYHHHGITAISDDSCNGLAIDWNLEGIWLMDSAGTNPRLLIRGGDEPVWSSDSKWIVFEAGAIWKIKIDGDSLTRLTFRRAFWSPDVSPDNNKVAVYNTLIDSAGIWIADFDGLGGLAYWGGGVNDSLDIGGGVQAYVGLAAGFRTDDSL